MKKRKKAFTLIELLVVIAIIAILAAVIAPNAFKAIEKSKASAFTSDANTIKKAMVLYYADTGQYPSYKYNGTDPDTFNWIGEAFLIKGNTSGKPSGVSIPATGTQYTNNIPNWNGPYVEMWPQKNPFGGYYTIFDYGNYRNDQSIMGGIKKYKESSKTFWTDYQNKQVVTVEIGFGSDKAARDKALEIIFNYMEKDKVYYQDFNNTYFQVIIPVLIN